MSGRAGAARPAVLVLVKIATTLAAFRDPSGLSPLLAGTLGGLLATWVTFAPCFLWILLGAPFIERIRGNPALTGALSAITAAVVGVILNLAIWFAVHTLFREVRTIALGPITFHAPVLETVNVWPALLSLAAVIAIFRFKVGMIPVLLGSCAARLLLFFAGVLS